MNCRPPLVLVSNMYPSAEHPAYGIFVQRFATLLEADFRLTVYAMQRSQHRWRRLGRYLRVNAQLGLSLLRARHAVHVVHFPLYFSPVLCLARLTGTRLVLNFHGSDNMLDTRIKRWFGGWLKVALVDQHVIAPSQHLAAALRDRYSLRAEQVFVSPSAGFDPARFAPPGAPQPSPVVRVGFVSSVLAAKGWRLFLALAEELIRRHGAQAMQFSMAGDGPEAAALDAELSRRQVSVERLSTLSGDALVKHFQNLSVLVFCSERESLGLVGVECLACGTPVIAQDIPGPSEYIVPGVNGQLVPQGDVCGLADSVAEFALANNRQQSALSATCVASVQSYRVQVVRRELLAFLHQVECAGAVLPADSATPTSRPEKRLRFSASSTPVPAGEPGNGHLAMDRQLAVLLGASSATHQQQVLDALTDTDDHEADVLLRYAADSLVLPALWPRLENRVPNNQPARTLLELAALAYQQNHQRNSRLLEEYSAVEACLHTQGIRPLPLKGLHLIRQDPQCRAAWRVVADLDLLIPTAAVTGALESLAELGFQQAINRYEKPLAQQDVYQAIDTSEFRNQADFVDCHVPRLWRAGSFASVELHLHVTHQQSALSVWLDRRAVEQPDSLFHLMHNFEHSHCKNGNGKLGVVDWRHLLDAAEGFRGEDVDELAGQMLEVATRHGLATEMAVHLWQLDHMLGMQVLAKHWQAQPCRSAIRRFQRLQQNSAQQRRLHRWEQLRRVVGSACSPRVRQQRYGPMPWHRQLLKTCQFYQAQLKR